VIDHLSRAAPDTRPSLLDLPLATARAMLDDWFRTRGEPAFRAGQVVRRLWEVPAAEWSAITELPVALRVALDSAFQLPRLELVARQRSTDGTEKFLFRLHDGQTIETVAIPDGARMTFCISSQAGCALKCAFCATGVMGFQRNLTPGEIAGQVRELALLDPPIRATNIVFMGMGEPLMNWTSVDVALSLLNDPQALGIGARHITVSTVGVLPGIEALAARPEQFRLALSIHAPFDDLRQSLMPVNIKYPLADVIAAAAGFDRRVTFEYVMLGGVNDASEHADGLAQLARDCRAFVNLIPLHPGGALGFHPTPASELNRFARRVRSFGVEVAIRRSRGLDIAAACGQLRTEKVGRRVPVPSQSNGEVELS
jgi:23S rRNA (adenine2503-C2)-methyltransferase